MTPEMVSHVEKTLQRAVEVAAMDYRDAVIRMMQDSKDALLRFEAPAKTNWNHQPYAVTSFELNVGAMAADVVRAAGKLKATGDALQEFRNAVSFDAEGKA